MKLLLCAKIVYVYVDNIIYNIILYIYTVCVYIYIRYISHMYLYICSVHITYVSMYHIVTVSAGSAGLILPRLCLRHRPHSPAKMSLGMWRYWGCGGCHFYDFSISTWLEKSGIQPPIYSLSI